MAIDFKEFKKVKLDTFNGSVSDSSMRDNYCLNIPDSNVDDKLWGVREVGAEYPVSQLWLGGKKYGEVNPKKEHTLPYYYNKDNGDFQFKFTPDFLMKEGVYVVDNDDDLESCKGITIETPNIKDEWQQYCENASMCDYGVGYSIKENKHIGIYTVDGNTSNDFFGSGYGLWSATTDNDITNPKNSCDFNGFINPQQFSKFKYTTIIGTDKGNTTGDWGGVLLMNDSNAHPRNFTCVDNDGNEYNFKRNSLYDLTDSNGVCDSKLTDNSGNTLWCAWVCENGDGSALVVYTKQIYDTSCGTYKNNGVETNKGEYVDYIPEIGENINIYFVPNNKTKANRLIFNDLNKSAIITNKQEAYGYVVTLNVLAQTSNDIHQLHYSGISYDESNGALATCGTIQVFAEVWPCDGEFYGSRVENSKNQEQCHFVLGDALHRYNSGWGSLIEFKDFNPSYCLSDGTPYMKGTKLVSYGNYNPTGYQSVNDLSNKQSKYGFIRVDVNFNNGKLTLNFSDCITGNTSDFNSNDLFSDTNLESGSLKLNGSELIIDFNSTKYSLTPYDDYIGGYEEKDFATLINSAITIDVKDYNGNSKQQTINVIESFKSNVKFGFHQWSFQNLYYKCKGFSVEDRLILDIENNCVWIYDYLSNDYIVEDGTIPTSYFTGSHISYNEITGKLWYSNGTEITQIGTNCGCDEGLNQAMIFVTHEELKDLRDNGLLIPGMQYRLIDYECTVNIKNWSNESDLTDMDYARAKNEGHFDIILVADDESTLNENVRFTNHSGDTYFNISKLRCWEGKYCIDNDTTHFDWAYDTDGKGVIYYLKDEYDNECPYDFKNIQFKRIENDTEKWYYTFNVFIDDNVCGKDASSIIKPGNFDSDYQTRIVNNNSIKQFVGIENSFAASVYLIRNRLPNIVFDGGDVLDDNGSGFSGIENNKFGFGCHNMTFGYNCNFNTFGNNCSYNTFGHDCNFNTFGNFCSNNTFSNECSNNTFGNECFFNVFNVDFITKCTLSNGVINCYIDTTTSSIMCLQYVNIFSGDYSSNPINDLGVGKNYNQVCGFNSKGDLIIANPLDYLISGVNV